MDDEVYMYTLAGPEEMAGPQVTEAGSQAEFAEWAGVVNGVLSGGREDLHPVYHYPLCRNGLLRCYFLRDTEGRVVSAAALAVDAGPCPWSLWQHCRSAGGRDFPGPCAGGPSGTPLGAALISSLSGPSTA